MIRFSFKTERSASKWKEDSRIFSSNFGLDERERESKPSTWERRAHACVADRVFA